MTGLEAAFAALVLAALARWLLKVRRFVFRNGPEQPAPDGVRFADDDWRTEVDTLVEWLEAHAIGGEGFSASGEVRRHLDRVRNLLVRIPEEVFDDIRRELIEGHNQGDSTKTIADKIDRVLNVTGSENWRNRAQVIAVTEVNGALNAGWFAGAVAQQTQLGQPLAKKWIATHDTHTRSTHREADGQTVPLLSPFIVGNSALLYPGDKSGPPEEVINCRCTAAVVEPQ